MSPAALVLVGLLVIWALESGRISAFLAVLTNSSSGNTSSGGAGASGGF